MMDDFDILRDLFREDALASFEGNGIILVEQNNPSYTLKITGISNDAIAFKADKFPNPGNIFKNTKHECKRADYVIIARSDNQSRIVYVEMKYRGNQRGKDSRLQLLGAKCLVAYCRSIVQEFWHEHRFLEGYDEHFVSIFDINLDKRQTQASKSGSDPNQILKLRAPKGRLPFNKLLGAARR